MTDSVIGVVGVSAFALLFLGAVLAAARRCKLPPQSCAEVVCAAAYLLAALLPLLPQVH